MLALSQRVIESRGRNIGLVSVTRSGNPWGGTETTGTTTVKGVQAKGKGWTVNGVPAGEAEVIFLVAGGLTTPPDNTMRVLDGTLPDAPAPVPIGLTAPLDGAYLGNTGIYTFTWTPGSYTVDVWELVVGSAVNANNYHSSGALAGAILSAVVAGLPTDGSTVYARLGKSIAGVITYQYYSFTAGVDPGAGSALESVQYKIIDVETVCPGDTDLLYLIRAGR